MCEHDQGTIDGGNKHASWTKCRRCGQRLTYENLKKKTLEVRPGFHPEPREHTPSEKKPPKSDAENRGIVIGACAACTHAELKHGANASGAWATCKICGRRVEYVDKKSQKVVREPGFTGICSQKARDLWIPPAGWKPAERIPEQEALVLFTDTRGRVIADSGCKRSVAGSQWHQDTKSWLAERGLKPIEEECKDKFRFGDGRVVTAKRSWRYPCGIYGYNGTLSIAEVSRD